MVVVYIYRESKGQGIYLALFTDLEGESWYLFVRLLHSSHKLILSFENVSKRDTILAPDAKQWIAKDIPSYWANQNTQNCYSLIWQMPIRHTYSNISYGTWEITCQWQNYSFVSKTFFPSTISNSLDSRQGRDLELVSSLVRVCNSESL